MIIIIIIVVRTEKNSFSIIKMTPEYFNIKFKRAYK